MKENRFLLSETFIYYLFIYIYIDSLQSYDEYFINQTVHEYLELFIVCKLHTASDAEGALDKVIFSKRTSSYAKNIIKVMPPPSPKFI